VNATTIVQINNGGIYIHNCKDFPLHCIDQTGLSFSSNTYNTEEQYKTGNILDIKHSAYRLIIDTVKIIKIARKYKHSESFEKYCIYCIYKQSRHLNNTQQY
jgi:hypothetical protein